MRKSPERSCRNRILLMVLNEETSAKWFEFSGRGIKKAMFYGCDFCRWYYSAESEMALEKSKVLLQKWVNAIFLCTTNLKVVSPVKLHRDLKVPQQTAWFMLHQIREFSPISLGMQYSRARRDLCRRSGGEQILCTRSGGRYASQPE